MLKHNAIQNLLISYVDNDDTSTESLREYRNESEYLCESIEYGLSAIGKMMEDLGSLADEKTQNFSHQALDNKTVRDLGSLIRVNAYLLHALRDTSANATFHLNGGIKGAK